MNVSKSNKLTKLQNDEIKLNILFNKVFPQISIDFLHNPKSGSKIALCWYEKI